VVVVVESGGEWGKWTNEAIAAALQAPIVRARRTSREACNAQ
jgi:hypothetical protein